MQLRISILDIIFVIALLLSPMAFILISVTAGLVFAGIAVVMVIVTLVRMSRRGKLAAATRENKSPRPD